MLRVLLFLCFFALFTGNSCAEQSIENRQILYMYGWDIHQYGQRVLYTYDIDTQSLQEQPYMGEIIGEYKNSVCLFDRVKKKLFIEYEDGFQELAIPPNLVNSEALGMCGNRMFYVPQVNTNNVTLHCYDLDEDSDVEYRETIGAIFTNGGSPELCDLDIDLGFGYGYSAETDRIKISPSGNIAYKNFDIEKDTGAFISWDDGEICLINQSHELRDVGRGCQFTWINDNQLAFVTYQDNYLHVYDCDSNESIVMPNIVLKEKAAVAVSEDARYAASTNGLSPIIGKRYSVINLYSLFDNSQKSINVPAEIDWLTF